MKYGTCFTAITLALILSVSPTFARSHKHPQHPMVQGLGIGLKQMLDSQVQKDTTTSYGGPASMPRYAPQQHAEPQRGGTGLPNLMDVPPKGWPLQSPTRAIPVHHRKPVIRHPQHHDDSGELPVAHAIGGGIVTVATAAGIPIKVAAAMAEKFQGLIADLVAHGYRPHAIGCFARGGHIPGSRHYAGAACDIDQRSRNRTAGFMYHAHAIIVAHGLRDGCDFNDCGHVDDGLNGYARSRHVRLAHRHYGRRRYAGG